jgi:orotate phosphoribosyltransferase
MKARRVVLPFVEPLSRRQRVTSSRHFLRRLAELAKYFASTSDATIILDFFDTNPFPKFVTAQRFITLLKKQAGRRHPIILANVTPELLVSVAQPFLANTPVLTGFAVWLVIGTDGAWRCLSSLPQTVADALIHVIRNGSYPIRDLLDRVGADETVRQMLMAACDANPSLFRYKSRDESIHLAFDLVAVLEDLLRYERKRLSDVVARRVIAPGHFLLPSGLHAEAIVQTFTLPQDEVLFGRVCAQVARYIWAAAPDVLLTFSNTSFLIAERLRALGGFGVVHTFGYPKPRPRYEDRLRAKQRVVILADIYSTGASLNHLRRLVLAAGAVIEATIVVADAHGGAARDGVSGLFRFRTRATAPAHCRLCRAGKRLQPVDPYSCLPYSPPNIHRRTATLSQEVFWRLVREHDAVHIGHRLMNGTHFDVFFEMRKVLRNAEARRTLAAAAMANRPPHVDMIACPKNEGALLLASAIGEYLERQGGTAPLIVTTSRDHAHKLFVLPKLLRSRAKGASVLVVDDGANTGETLLGLHFALKGVGAALIRYVVCLDRLVGADEECVSALLGSSYEPLFRVPIPAYRAWDCPVCIRNAEQDYQATTSAARDWALAVRTGERIDLPDDVYPYGGKA